MPIVHLVVLLAIGFPVIVLACVAGDRMGKRRKNKKLEDLVKRGVNEQQFRNTMIIKKPRDSD
jgi:hypothetical protein